MSASDPSDVSRPAAPSSRLASLDAWVEQNPWHPRILPMLVYLLGLFVVDQGRSLSLYSYPVLYALQCGLTAWLLWRYRRLLPEMTLRFHWLAIPTGVGLCVVWVVLGRAMVAWSPGWFAPPDEPHYFQQMESVSPALYWLSLGLRLLGMTLLVPLFEELFVRSACLRGLHSARKTGLGLVQFAEDLPIVDEWIMNTRLGQRAAERPPMFTQQLTEWPVGPLTVFGVLASTVIFSVNHVPRDWPGAVACGLVWCGLLWWTNRGGRKLGLGPIAWSHGITNALLWAYCLYAGGDAWMFM